MKTVEVSIVVSLLACIVHSITASEVYEPLEQRSITNYDWAKNYNFQQKFRQAFDRLTARLFKTFERAYNRTYRPEEVGRRLELLAENFRMIRDWNALYAQGKVSYSMKVNHLADRTEEELAHLDGVVIPEDVEFNLMSKKSRLIAQSKGYDNLPSEIDYSKHPCNTPVRHQGSCGSCYAFATADLVGITRCIQSGNDARYRSPRSPQYIVDCGKDYPSGIYGCNGGWPGHVLKFLRKTGGLATESSYPYKNHEGTCKKNVFGYTLPYQHHKDPEYKYLESEEEFKKYLANYGPIVATVDVTQKFNLYDAGIFDDTSCRDNIGPHAVLVVGYGRESGKDYWLIKNSWGEDWGENGYMKIVRGKYLCNLGYMGWGLPYRKSKNYY